MTRDGLAPRRRWPAGARLVVFVAVLVLAVGVTVTALNRSAGKESTMVAARVPAESPPAKPLTDPARLAKLGALPGAPAPGGDVSRHTLVLYDEDGTPGLGHQYAIQAANLASHGGAWELRPILRYRPGDLTRYTAAIYLGVGDGPLPSAFLRDVSGARIPVLWLGSGIDQLFGFDRANQARLGWSPAGDDPVAVTGVRYRGRLLPRRAQDNDAPVRITVHNRSSVQVLGLAEHADGSTTPWAVQSGSLRYIGEIPFSYAVPGDRSLAAADLIDRTVRPVGPDRHRALIRIEDVGPNSDPADIRAIANYLSQQGIPFTLAVYPYYRDPNGAAHSGTPVSFRLVDRPEMVDALNYALHRGGMIAMHGYTHQFENRGNPYRGTSADDFEFYLAHVDAANNVQLDGPVPQDSVVWAKNRMELGRAEFTRVGLPDPDLFEFPHYTGSAASYRAAHEVFGVRYDQGTYFDGLCPDGDCTKQSGTEGELFQQFFPYPVRDVYGSVVIPENLLNVSSAYNNNPPRSVQNVLDSAAAMTVVRDGVLSTFYHPFLGVPRLEQVVTGIEKLGYTFVSPYELLELPR